MFFKNKGLCGGCFLLGDLKKVNFEVRCFFKRDIIFSDTKLSIPVWLLGTPGNCECYLENKVQCR